MNSGITFYIRLLIRRLPAMLALFLFASCIGIVIALRLPAIYEARATLLVEEAQIPEQMVRGTVQVRTEDQLEIIQRRLLTRANLIDVARNNRVFPNHSQMNPDDVVQHMRQSTMINLSRRRDSATLVLVSFRDVNARRSAAVVNEYVTLILESNTDIRSQQVGDTLAFFEQEVETISDNLDAQSNRIVAFQNENSDALPENLNFRMSRQSLLQERLSRVARDLERLLRQRETVKQTYARTGELSAVGTSVRTPEETRLSQLQSELRVALTVYSEQNPRVRLLRNQIDALEEQIKLAVLDSSGANAGEGGADSASDVSALDASLIEINSEIESLEQEAQDVQQELLELEESINRTPANAIALENMLRDQHNLQTLYSAAVQRLSQAQMGERIELSAKGERITVLEPANVPNSPSSPNRPKIAAAGISIGFALAAGMFVLLEVLNTSIRRPVDITRAFDITPLATIQRYETAADRRRRRRLQILVTGVVLVTVPGTLWAIDTFYQPLDQLIEKIITRFT